MIAGPADATNIIFGNCADLSVRYFPIDQILGYRCLEPLARSKNSGSETNISSDERDCLWEGNYKK